MFVLQTFAPYINSYLFWGEPGGVEKKALSFQNIFVENDQARTSLSQGVLTRMITERLRCKTNRFGNRIHRDIATPLLDNGFPRESGRYLVEYVCYENSGASKSRLTVTNFRIGNHKSPDYAFGREGISTFDHCSKKPFTHDPSIASGEGFAGY